MASTKVCVVYRTPEEEDLTLFSSFFGLFNTSAAAYKQIQLLLHVCLALCSWLSPGIWGIFCRQSSSGLWPAVHCVVSWIYPAVSFCSFLTAVQSLQLKSVKRSVSTFKAVAKVERCHGSLKTLCPNESQGVGLIWVLTALRRRVGV